MHTLLYILAPQLVAAVSIGARDASYRAAYFLDNNPAGSSIVALKIADDGTLSSPVRTLTGGKGLFGTGGAPPVANMGGKIREEQRLALV